MAAVPKSQSQMAASVNSLLPRKRPIKKIKAAIQGGGCTEPNVAPAIKASIARIVYFAKSQKRLSQVIKNPSAMLLYGLS